MSSAWPRFCGAICGTRRSRRRRIFTSRRSHRPGQPSRLHDPGRIIKQKLPENNGGYKALNTAASATANTTSGCTRSSAPTMIDLTRYQVVNCYMGRCGLIKTRAAPRGNTIWPRPSIRRWVNKRGRRHGPDQRTPSLSAAPLNRRHRAVEQDSRRLSGYEHFRGLRRLCLGSRKFAARASGKNRVLAGCEAAGAKLR